MSAFETEINRLVEDFVAQVAELAREAAIRTLGGTLGDRRPTGEMRVQRPAQRGNRSSEQLDALRGQLLAFVKAHPGSRTEQINRSIGTTTSEVALPLRKLVADGMLKTKGQRRGTQYFLKG